MERTNKCVECEKEVDKYFLSFIHHTPFLPYCKSCFSKVKIRKCVCYFCKKIFERDNRKMNPIIGNAVCDDCYKTRKKDIPPCGNPACPPRSRHEH